MNNAAITRKRFSRTRPARILVVEGDHVTAESYRAGLRIAGFDVDCSRDGEEALARIVEAGIPDLIVLDLGLPRVVSTRGRRDAYDVLDIVHACRLTDRLPVLALSNDDRNPFEALHRGASHCVPAQLRASTLVSMVTDIIQDRMLSGWIHFDK